MASCRSSRSLGLAGVFFLLHVFLVPVPGKGSEVDIYTEARERFYQRQQFRNVGIIIPEDSKVKGTVRFGFEEEPEKPVARPLVLKTSEGIASTLSLEKKPKFCNGLDCPDYKVLSQSSDYEERLYKMSRWVSTSLTGVDLKEATETMFMRLFNYISGKNKKKEKIDMTAPVITSIIPGPGPACANNFTMSFFISTSLKNPPQPSEDTVFLSNLPRQKVFVKSFGGFSNKEKWLKYAEALLKALKRDGKQFNNGTFYSAGYDSPFKVFNRHNEVWYIEN